MERTLATQKLTRILTAVDSETFPVKIREVHIFGSYSRGAPQPRDLDIIIVHDELSPELIEQLNAEGKKRWGLRTTGYYDHSPWTVVRQRIAHVLRRPGEKLELFWGTSREQAFQHICFRDIKPILLWSDTDRDWASKLAAIVSDPDAQRHPRYELVDPYRIRPSFSDLQDVTLALKHQFIQLERIPLADAPTDLNPLYRNRLDIWASGTAFGAKTLKLVPYALAWLQRQPRQSQVVPETGLHCAILSLDGKYAAYMGRPALRSALEVLAMPGTAPSKPFLKVCLILAPKKNEPNELLVFSAGTNRDLTQFERLLRNRSEPSSESGF